MYRKSLEGKQKEEFEKKRAIRKALAEGKPIPSYLKEYEAEVRHDMEMEDQRAQDAPDMKDDEYRHGGSYEPKILLTTSRDPSSRLIQFAKELKLVFPNSQRINRGGHVVKDLVDACKANGVTDMIVLHETRGQPDGMIVSHLPYGPTAYFGLMNAVLRHDIQKGGGDGDDADTYGLTTVSQVYPHLLFENFSSKLGERVKCILQYLFPVPKPDSRRVLTFANEDDFISFRHHVFKKGKGKSELDLREIGPRFELRLYQIQLGTVDVKHAAVEWSLRSFMNTSKSRQFLSEETR